MFVCLLILFQSTHSKKVYVFVYSLVGVESWHHVRRCMSVSVDTAHRVLLHILVVRLSPGYSRKIEEESGFGLSG